MSNIQGPFADTSDMPRVHTMFRREFGLLPALVDRVRAADRARSRIVADHVEFLGQLLENHHQSEDESLWPKLLLRGHEEVAPVVHLMESQHQRLAANIAEVLTELGAWLVSAASERRETLGSALERLVPLLKEHMSLEEERILPLAERYVTAAEWAEMVQKGAARVRLDDIPLIMGMIMYDGGGEIGPPEVHALADAAPRAFASYAKRVHGTATPPRSAG